MSQALNQRQFMEACGQLLPHINEIISGRISIDQARLYADLTDEEWHDEFGPVFEMLEVAVTEEGRLEALVLVADALADVLVTVNGLAISLGLPIEDIFAEVHRTNMAKVGPDGKVVRREDGKILKPEGWEPPKIRNILLKELLP